MPIERIDPAYTSPAGFALIFVIVIVSLAWSYGPGIRRELFARQSQAVRIKTPRAITRIPHQAERRSQAYPVSINRRPMRGINRLLELLFKGGSISGY